jgi:hypothetical protein
VVSDVQPAAGTPASRNTRIAAFLAPVGVAVVVIANAWGGLMPGVGFWDTGEFQTVLPLMGTAHPTGYPTYVLLGWLANILLSPIGDPAYRMNALTLIVVGVAAGTTVALVRRLTGSTLIGVAAGVGLATTPLVWNLALRADPHPVHLAFVALLLFALVRWEQGRRSEDHGTATRSDRWLLLAAMLFGLAAGNHSLTLLFAPPIALYVLGVDPGIWRRWRFALACLAVAVGTLALVYLELPLRGGAVPALTAPLVYAKPATWDGFWYIALAEQFRGSLSSPFADLGIKAGKMIEMYASPALGPLLLAVPAAFLVTALRFPRYALLTGLAAAITILFNMSYSNADIGRYYLGPLLMAWTWLAILAAELASLAGFYGSALVQRLRSMRVDDAAIERATAIAAAALAIVLVAPAVLDLDQRRHEADRSGDTFAAEWLAQVLPVIPDNAVLVSWWSTSTALWYAQKLEGRIPDVFIVDDRTMLDQDLGRAPDVIRRYLGEGRPVYAIRLDGGDTNELTSQFDMSVVAGSGSLSVWAVHGLLAASR